MDNNITPQAAPQQPTMWQRMVSLCQQALADEAAAASNATTETNDNEKDEQ